MAAETSLSEIESAYGDTAPTGTLVGVTHAQETCTRNVIGIVRCDRSAGFEFLVQETVNVIFRPHGRTISHTVGYFPSTG